MKFKILLVDDEEDMLDVMKFYLEGIESQIEVAGSGEDALKMLSRKKFDLVMTDFRMPGVTGLELSKRIRAQFETTPIIVCTNDIEVTEQMTLDAGAMARFDKDLGKKKVINNFVRQLLRIK